MAELILVRHAQAAFGTDDYDRLTELGHRQARWLGEYFADQAIAFDRVVSGSLRRHRETLAGIAEALSGLPAADIQPGLNEYQADVLLAAHLAARGLPPLEHAEDRRGHFRVLRDALYGWVDGTLQAHAHLPFPEFEAGVRQALEAARHGAGRVLVVSSGGPISSAIGAVLGVAPRTVVDLNLQTRNTGLSELRAGAQRAHCVSFNAVPHLERPGRREAITYS
ncbi:MAG TPA: histidine phosphatase family protein [Burkholderiales bacterium]|nr:histidine phosphatase family protein [Burkholderiales bacterium]